MHSFALYKLGQDQLDWRRSIWQHPCSSVFSTCILTSVGPFYYFNILSFKPIRCGSCCTFRLAGGPKYLNILNRNCNIDFSCVLQDCLVYLLNREQHTVGQETPSARPNICLFSPDILPLHCRLRRVPAPRRHTNSNKGDDLTESQRFCVAVEPVLNATVLVNFSRCERTTTLRHGDLLSFGAHYIFLYKDPTGSKTLPAQTLARLRTLGQLYDSGVEEGEDGSQTCKMCGSVLKEKTAQVLSVPAVKRSFKPLLVKPRGVGMVSGGQLPLSGGETAGRGGQKRKLQLEFDLTHEDQLLNRIVSLIEPGGECLYY